MKTVIRIPKKHPTDPEPWVREKKHQKKKRKEKNQKETARSRCFNTPTCLMFSQIILSFGASTPVDVHVHNGYGETFLVNYYPPNGLPNKNNLHLVGDYHDLTATFQGIQEFQNTQYVARYTTSDHFSGEGLFLALDYGIAPLTWIQTIQYYMALMQGMVRSEDWWALERPSEFYNPHYTSSNHNSL